MTNKQSRGVTACIITLNEEERIEKCLSSINFVDEIIIVDSGSSDKTKELAQKNAKVKFIYREFDNYISQKNYCISLAKNDWILVLDADEELSSELQKEIQENLINPEIVGFFFPRLTFYLGKWIQHGGWYPNYQMKYFRKSKGRFTGQLVHETVSIDGQLAYCKYPLYHYSYKNIGDHLNYINKYSSLHAQEKFMKGKKTYLFLAIGEGIYKFIFMYIIKLGFLDGRVGLIIAILGGFYNFLKYIKLYELRKLNTQDKI